MANIESLRGKSPAAKYRQFVAASQNQYMGAGGKLVMTPAEYQAALAEGAKIAVVGQRDVQTLFGYSSVLYEVDGVISGLNTVFTLAAGVANDRKFFQYGVDDQNNVVDFGGFPAGYQARYDDTNLTKAGKPPFGSMLIDRIGFILRPVNLNSCDPQFIGAVLSATSIKIGTNGSQNQKHLGSMAFWCGQQGPIGNGLLHDGTAVGHQGLGAQMGPDHMRKLDEPFLWKSNGSKDCDLCVTLSVEHDIELTYTTADLRDAGSLNFCVWCIAEGRSAEELSANG